MVGPVVKTEPVVSDQLVVKPESVCQDQLSRLSPFCRISASVVLVFLPCFEFFQTPGRQD